MCRPKAAGGRRCPGHPKTRESVEARNERRRAAYAAKMQGEGEAWRDEGFLHPRLWRRGIGPDSEDLDNLADIGQRWRESLTPEERRAVSQYTMGAFDYINPLLRGGEEAYRQALVRGGTWAREEDFDDAYALHTEYIKHLDSAFAKHPSISLKRTLYRSIKTGDELGKDWAKTRFKPGEEVTFPEFSSTSLDSDFAFYYAHQRNTPEHTVVLEIKARDGIILHEKSSRGAYSVQDDEREILLDRGSRFKVVGVHESIKFEAARDTRYWRKGQRMRVTVVQLVQMGEEADANE